MNATPVPTKKRRPGLLRNLTGIFNIKAPWAQTSKLGRRQTFKRVLRKRDKQAPGMEDSSGTKENNDPPPEYSVLEGEQRTRVTSDHPGSTPPTNPPCCFCDESRAHNNTTSSIRSRSWAEGQTHMIPEITTTCAKDDKPSDNTKPLPTLSEFLEALPKIPPPRRRDRMSRGSEFSDGSYDLHQPIPIRTRSWLASDGMVANNTPVQSIYTEDAQQPEQAHRQKFNADLAYALYLQSLETSPLDRPEYLEPLPHHVPLSKSCVDVDELSDPFMKSCHICHERLSISEFPLTLPTEACVHGNDTCANCLRGWLLDVLETKCWGCVACPQCRMPLSREDIRRGVSWRS